MGRMGEETREGEGEGGVQRRRKEEGKIKNRLAFQTAIALLYLVLHYTASLVTFHVTAAAERVNSRNGTPQSISNRSRLDYHLRCIVPEFYKILHMMRSSISHGKQDDQEGVQCYFLGYIFLF